jgi:hypothetical protein
VELGSFDSRMRSILDLLNEVALTLGEGDTNPILDELTEVAVLHPMTSNGNALVQNPVYEDNIKAPYPYKDQTSPSLQCWM